MQPFDLAKALTALAPVFVREIIEQRRTEWIADELWSQRPPTDALSAESVSPFRKSAVPERMYRSLALLWPLIAGGQHTHNRNLLFNVLGKAATRRNLLEAFDRAFYRCSNPDVPAAGFLPLLHYVFYGYREGRRPSPDWDSSISRHGERGGSGPASNPLLQRIATASRARGDVSAKVEAKKV